MISLLTMANMADDMHNNHLSSFYWIQGEINNIISWFMFSLGNTDLYRAFHKTVFVHYAKNVFLSCQLLIKISLSKSTSYIWKKNQCDKNYQQHFADYKGNISLIYMYFLKIYFLNSLEFKFFLKISKKKHLNFYKSF